MCGWSSDAVVATEFRHRGMLERPDDLDSCPVEFSMTCTNGVLVDIFERLEVAKKGKGTVKQKRLFSVYCAFKIYLADGKGRFPTDVQC